MREHIRRSLSLLLALAMTTSLLGGTAWAAEETEADASAPVVETAGAADSSESRRRCRAFRMQYRKAPRRQAERLLLLTKPALQVRPYSRPASCSLSRRNWYFSYASLTFLT